jgi:hypothetical protein
VTKKEKHFVGKETDIAQCALKCCNATIVYVSRLRVKDKKMQRPVVKAVIEFCVN